MEELQSEQNSKLGGEDDNGDKADCTDFPPLDAHHSSSKHLRTATSERIKVQPPSGILQRGDFQHENKEETFIR